MKKINITKFILIYTIILIPIILLISFILFNNKEFKFDNENILINKENYNIKISYPKINDKHLNKKIKNMIDNEKKEFIDIVNEVLKTTKNNEPLNYELNINYNYTEFNDNIYSIHFKILKYTGGNHYEREDRLYYYHKEKDKEILLDDLIINKENLFKLLKEKSKEYLLQNKEKLQTFEEDLLNKGINNIEFLTFSEEYLWIIYPPYQVAPWSSGEISIPIDYNLVINYLNKDYFSSLENQNNNDLDKNNEEEKNTNNVQAIIRDSTYFKDKKLIALTFDDGPSWGTTEKLLDGLRKRNAKVSFFMLGNRAKSQKNLVKRIYDEGHTIGSHTYDHKNLKNLETTEISYEINETNNILKDITGITPKYLRPPYGNYNKDILDATNMAFILWNVDTEDWKKKDSDKIAEYIIEEAQDGAIILLHDLYNTSVEGALKAIDELQDKGYAFVSLDELIKYKNITVENHKAYRYFK